MSLIHWGNDRRDYNNNCLSSASHKPSPVLLSHRPYNGRKNKQVQTSQGENLALHKHCKVWGWKKHLHPFPKNISSLHSRAHLGSSHSLTIYSSNLLFLMISVLSCSSWHWKAGPLVPMQGPCRRHLLGVMGSHLYPTPGWVCHNK
jgi:hypothetical protein